MTSIRIDPDIGPGTNRGHLEQGCGARRGIMKLNLDSLNSNQLQAVNWQSGPLLVRAGPGAGKTHVLTTRIARIILDTPDARFRVLGLTFTTKAADEMRGRVDDMLGGPTPRVRLATFHSFGRRRSASARQPLRPAPGTSASSRATKSDTNS